ncbi:MAG: hypothetical protein IPO07_31155 [Haliscomenobacter sp.]|nr:hypothetical protein [Haliscomenobacter sp.]MBK9492737.1 hypothetical protein [Haliscomenobacter sp.]
MDVLYFAFANHPDRPLDELKREDAEINRLLEPLAARGLFKIVRDSFASLDSVADKLDLYKRDLVHFHYSGHAGPDSLELLGETARSKGIAALLGECKRLQIVVLNGCATFPQVDALLGLSIPLVIATQRPVEDPKAAAFAIQFYRSLSMLDTVEGAFKAARGRVLSMDDKLNISRGLALRNEPAVQQSDCWGLYGLPQREDAAKWRFSSSVNAPQLKRFEPNARLMAALMKALAPYREPIQTMLNDEAEGSEVDIIDKKRAVLEALPHPISELVRFLLVPSTNDAKDQDQFFDQPGPGRLRQILALYFTLLELMTFIMLAELWNVLQEKGEASVPEATRQLIRQFLLAEDDERSRIDHLTIIRAIRACLDAQGLPYFVEELQMLQHLAQEDSEFIAANTFFSELSPLFESLGQNEAELLCIDAEEHLARVFSQLGFLARYTFASVKNIDVLKYRHQPNPRYRHSMITLEQKFVGLSEKQRVIQGLLDSASVLLLKASKEGPQQFLNLTPFIIDQNAFDSEVHTLAKLHFYGRYIPFQDAYAFRHIYQPDDLPLVISEQKEYLIVKAQLDAFAQLLFQTPMQKLQL